jgi:hypothetical protein
MHGKSQKVNWNGGEKIVIALSDILSDRLQIGNGEFIAGSSIRVLFVVDILGKISRGD